MDGIQGYTRAQVSAFVDAIGRAEKADRLQHLADLRVAGADGKDFRNHVKEIER